VTLSGLSYSPVKGSGSLHLLHGATEGKIQKKSYAELLCKCHKYKELINGNCGCSEQERSHSARGVASEEQLQKDLESRFPFQSPVSIQTPRKVFIIVEIDFSFCSSINRGENTS
jgi:hypothetical protein